jgi:hypothetical protein
MKGKPLTPTGLRLILSISLFVITGIGGVAFSFANENLEKVAIDVNHKVVDASASQNNFQTLQSIQHQLEEKKDIVERARSIVADSQSYQYQDQIITDLSDYAKRSNIEITNMDFSAATQTGAAPKTTPSALTAPVPTGVKSTSVSVTLKNPVNYNNLLQFIYAIEQNLTKMQVSKVGLSKDATGGGITSDLLTIEVYVR